MIDSRIQAEHPGTIRLTLSTTMTAAEWKRVHEQLFALRTSGYEVSTLRRHICELILHAEKHFVEVATP